MRTRVCTSPGVWLVVLALWPTTVLAQPDDTPSSRLQFTVRPGRTTASLLLSSTPPDAKAIEDALAAALGERPTAVGVALLPGAWQITAVFAQLPVSQGMTHTLALDLDPLREELRRQGYQRCLVAVQHPIVGFSELPGVAPVTFKRTDRVGYQHLFAEGDAAPPPLRLTFGYRPIHLWPYAVLAGLSLLAITVTLWRRARALREPDAATAWLRHWRGQRVLGLAMWGAWLATLLALDVFPQTCMLLFGGVDRGRWLTWALMLVPLPLTLALGHVLSAAVYARVPAAGWSRWRVALQALFGQGAVAVVLLLSGWSVDLYRSGSWGWAVGAAAGALLVAALGYCGWRLARDVRGSAGVILLPAGAVRDRLFELAKGTATRVRQAYLLPGDCWRLLDVFARPGRVVHLTAEAVEGLGPRERDGVVALELEYLRRQRGEWLGLLLLTATAAAVAAVVAIGLRTLNVVWHEGVAYLVPLSAVLAVTLTERRLQRLGGSLDVRAARLTGDAEGLLAALAKLERVGMLPPSSPDRLETLAARANVTPERLRELRCGS